MEEEAQLPASSSCTWRRREPWAARNHGLHRARGQAWREQALAKREAEMARIPALPCRRASGLTKLSALPSPQPGPLEPRSKSGEDVTLQAHPRWQQVTVWGPHISELRWAHRQLTGAPGGPGPGLAWAEERPTGASPAQALCPLPGPGQTPHPTRPYKPPKVGPPTELEFRIQPGTPGAPVPALEPPPHAQWHHTTGFAPLQKTRAGRSAPGS